MVQCSTSRFAFAAWLPISLIVTTPVPAAEAPTCRELGRQLDDIKATTFELDLALFSAARAGCEPLARRLLAAGASLEARDRIGALPLTHAARSGHLAMVALFLEAGSPINARSIAGATALYAAAENERPSTVGILLAKGADPNLAAGSGVTPLAAAAYKGNDRVVELLLTHRADPNVVDTTGKAAIIYAAARGFVTIIARLLDAGVDVKQRYGNDLTALMWAAGHEDGVNARAAEDVVELLIARGAPLDNTDNRGRTALMIAAERGHVTIVDLLLRRGANPTLKDNDGKTALELAADARIRERLMATGQ
jgi:ankyrin repeat protein